MNILDIGIIIFLILGAIVGFKRGFTRELVEAVGFIAIVVLAYLFKNPLSVLFYEHLPFFKLGFLKGAEVLNIIIYEILAFCVLLLIFNILLKILLKITNLFEKILNATIILSIPSKLLGAVIGIFHHYVLVFVILYVLTLTCFDYDFVSKSDYREKIVEDTPVLSDLVDDSVKVVEEFKKLKNKYEDNTISEYEFNCSALQLFLKYKLVDDDSITKLIESGKITAFDNYASCIEGE